MFSMFHRMFDALTAAERKVFQSAAIIFAFALFMSGVNAFYGATIAAPVAGGAYTEGVVGQPTAINPIIAGSSDVDHDLIEATFSDLITLAETVKVSDDHRLFTVKLKGDLKWSDGEPLTADDVVFTLETIQDPEAHSPSFATWQGVAAERVSEREVRFTLRTPYAFFEDNLATLKVAPRHIFGAIPAANLRLSDYNLEPVGSGPYVFVRYEKRKDGFITGYEFKANPHFAGDEALIKEFSFMFFPTYEDATEAFNRHTIDGLGGLSNDDVDRLKIGHQLIEFSIPRYYAVFMNQSTSVPLRELAVRQALDLGTNRDEILDRALGGRGVTIGGPIPPGIEGYDATVGAGPTYSAEDAITLLEKAGWKKGDDGIRTKRVDKADLRLAFELVVPDIPFLKSAAETLVNEWAQIGIQITPIVRSPSEVSDDVVKTRNYQLLLFGNILKKNPDIFSFWHSSERFRPGLNLSLYENRNADILLDSIRRNFNSETRGRDVVKLQQIIDTDKPAVFLFSPHYLYAAPRDLGGLTGTLISAPSDRFAKVATWYLKTARVFR